MIRFLDGPASHRALMLRRAPLFLRVVRSAGGTWDALDQFDDEPRRGEKICVYRREGSVRKVHIHASGSGRSGYYAMADYRHVADAPTDGVLRDTEKWRAWCIQAAREHR